MRTFAKQALFGILALVVSACGPMNPKPASGVSGAGSNSLSANAQASETLTHSQDQLFILDIKLQNPGATSPAKPDIGMNQYVLRLVHANDLSPVSKGTEISVSYSHQHAKIPETFQGTVAPQDDGSFLVTVYFEKPGTWNLELHISEPQSGATAGSSSSTQDEYALSVSL